MRKIVIFAFRGDPMCFVHVLLNALDLHQKGMGGEIVVEGEATRLLPLVADKGHALFALYEKATAAGLIDAVCRACSTKMGVVEEIERLGLPLADDMSGHPGMGRYLEAGYEVITL